jgi:hypothetical protein
MFSFSDPLIVLFSLDNESSSKNILLKWSNSADKKLVRWYINHISIETIVRDHRYYVFLVDKFCLKVDQLGSIPFNCLNDQSSKS